MTPDELDAIEARARGNWPTSEDATALVAEVRRLRGCVEAVREYGIELAMLRDKPGTVATIGRALADTSARILDGAPASAPLPVGRRWEERSL